MIKQYLDKRREQALIDAEERGFKWAIGELYYRRMNMRELEDKIYRSKVFNRKPLKKAFNAGAKEGLLFMARFRNLASFK